jgi:4-hydroxy-tetrahydrodipicolinate reductase
MQPISPFRVLLVGAAGRMGRAIARLLADPASGFPLRLASAVDAVIPPDAAFWPVPLSTDLAQAAASGADVAIDFSSHAAAPATAAALAAARIPWVLGTTGLSPAERDAVSAAASSIPVLFAANMSLGVNLLHALVRSAASRLAGLGYDCEIIERHHRHKKDAPSGTALFLGQAAAEGYGWSLAETAVDGRSGATGERPERQIAFHAVRGGDILGDHTVLFAAEGELLELSHRITSRDTLARGALRAAAWLAAGRPPRLYGMSDVLGLTGGAP